MEIKKEIKRELKKENSPYKPTHAFIAASWIALFAGTIAYNIGLWNAEMQLNEKGYYFTVLLFGLFSVGEYFILLISCRNSASSNVL